MSDLFSPQQACDVVSRVTGKRFDPQTLRQWRARNLWSSPSKTDGAWARYSRDDLILLCVVVFVMQWNLPISRAVEIAKAAIEEGAENAFDPVLVSVSPVVRTYIAMADIRTMVAEAMKAQA